MVTCYYYRAVSARAVSAGTEFEKKAAKGVSLKYGKMLSLPHRGARASSARRQKNEKKI